MFRPSVSRQRRRQAGFALISALLALVIAALLARQQMEGAQLKLQMDAGRTEAQVLNLIAEATNNFAMEHYPELQNDLPITKNGVTLTPGSSAGNTLSPTVADLVALGYLGSGTSAQSLYVGGGTYQIRLRKEPAGCTGVACNIPGHVYIDRAAVVPGTTEMNAPMIGAFATQIGGSALYSTNANASVLTGPTGVNVTNPLGAVPGVLGVATGFGAAGFGRFLVLNDPRDPNFQGDLSVRGTIESRTEVSITNPTDTCDLASLWVNASGVSEFAARSATCVQRAWVRGDGTVGVADAAGNRRAEINGTTGEFTTYDTAGATRSGFTYNATGQSEAFADNLRNNAVAGSPNAAGINLDGRVYGRLGQFSSVVLNTTAGINASCTQPGEMVWGTLNANPILLKCEGGRYVPTDGTAIATGGGSCSVAGSTAKTLNGVHLICEGGTWRVTIQRLGRVQMDDSYVVGTGTFIPSPTCASGGTPALMLLPTALNAGTGTLTYRSTATTGGWTAEIIDNNGAQSIESRALAHTYCAY